MPNELYSKVKFEIALEIDPAARRDDYDEDGDEDDNDDHVLDNNCDFLSWWW